MRLILAALLLLCMPALAHDYGQWDGTDPRIRAWYGNLKWPDNPNVSCCGTADAYWADDFEVDKKTGQYIAIITDDRDDAALKRLHIAIGTRILIPPSKLRLTPSGNPTGHGVLFLSPTFDVYCYEPPTGG